MAATIGPGDIGVYDSPLPDLLRDVSGIAPVEAGTHVMLDEHGVRSTQRLAIGDVDGKVTVALWPAELKEQAKYLYGRRLGRPIVAAARERGWTAKANPHLAFRHSTAQVRLYMAPPLDAAEYARHWEEGDLGRVGSYPREDVRGELWPWLKSRGYATDDDDAILEEWLATRLGKRSAFLRPGLQFTRAWASGARRGTSALAEEIRADVDAILVAAHDPRLPATQRSRAAARS